MQTRGLMLQVEASNAQAGWLVLYPGDPDAPSGGFVYDRRIVAGLRQAGVSVATGVLPGAWPQVSQRGREAVDATFAALPDGTRVIVDGLAWGALPDVARRHGARLCIVALVHHPLWAENADCGSKALRETETEALRHVRAVIVTSEATAQMVRDMGVPSSRLYVVEPGSAAPSVRALPDRSQGRRRDGPVRLLCVASLIPRKAHGTLFEALAQLRDEDWVLECIGSDALNPEHAALLRRRVDALGMGERIRLRGAVGARELQAHRSRADAFVLVPRFEGYGMAVEEAVVHGLPTVTGNVEAVPALGPDAPVCRVAPDDVPALREAIANELLIATRRDAHAARIHAWLQARADRGEGRPTWAQASSRFARALHETAAANATVTTEWTRGGR